MRFKDSLQQLYMHRQGDSTDATPFNDATNPDTDISD